MLSLLAICAVGPASADWLYDGYPIYNLGVGVGKGRPTEMVAQPFSVPRAGEIEQLGVAIARGADPNNVGFRVTLAEDYLDLGKTTLASWQVLPIYGPTLMFVYWSIKPIPLDAGQTYYLVLAPGDSEFMGAVAYATHGNLALATNDDGATWQDIGQLGVRVGGTMVTEPSAFMVLGVGCWVLGWSRICRRTKTPLRRNPV
jgi:hypothetical protein